LCKVFVDKKFVARSVRIMNTSPSINLHLVWRNLSQVVVMDAAGPVRHLVIYDLVPTNVRL